MAELNNSQTTDCEFTSRQSNTPPSPYRFEDSLSSITNISQGAIKFEDELAQVRTILQKELLKNDLTSEKVFSVRILYTMCRICQELFTFLPGNTQESTDIAKRVYEDLKIILKNHQIKTLFYQKQDEILQRIDRFQNSSRYKSVNIDYVKLYHWIFQIFHFSTKILLYVDDSTHQVVFEEVYQIVNGNIQWQSNQVLYSYDDIYLSKYNSEIESIFQNLNSLQQKRRIYLDDDHGQISLLPFVNVSSMQFYNSQSNNSQF